MKSLRHLIGMAVSRFSVKWWPLAILGIGILVLPVPTRAWQPVDRTFRIEAHRFAYSPFVLKVNPGDRVTLELVSTDVVHGLALDGYDVDMTADPGQTASLTFVADRVGSFRFRCTATCGPLHPFMIGKIQVGQNTLWLRAAGLAILSAAAIIGRRIL